MSYRYSNPSQVLSPVKNVQNVNVLFDGGNTHGSFSVASLRWNGDDVIALRWNISENEARDPDKINGNKLCLGEPNSRGYSTWFILPDEFISNIVDNGSLMNELKQYLKRK